MWVATVVATAVAVASGLAMESAGIESEESEVLVIVSDWKKYCCCFILVQTRVLISD